MLPCYLGLPLHQEFPPTEYFSCFAQGVVHTTGGYMVGAGVTTKYVFDLQPGDVYWCSADCGWITGHTYLTYGPLLNGATCVLFGSTPVYPDAGRCWQVIEVRMIWILPPPMHIRHSDSLFTRMPGSVNSFPCPIFHFPF